MSRSSDTRSRRILAVLLAIALGALVTVLVPATATAHNHSTTPHPTATRFNVTRLFSPTIAVPETPGAPASYIVKDVGFQLDVSFTASDGTTPLPLSYTSAVTIGLTVVSGPGSGTRWTTVVPKGATSATFNQTFSQAGNGAVLRVSNLATHPSDLITTDTLPFDVLTFSAPAPANSPLTGVGGGGGIGTPCSATPGEPVCADLQLPNGAATAPGLLSLGVCDAVDTCSGQSVQVLIGLNASRSNPAALVMKCDKSLCPGGGIKSYKLKVTLTPGTPAVTAPSCPKKNTVGADQKFCVDYVQSSRDNAGDTHLYLLFVEDAKVRFP